jgi:hypothetical protein
MPHTEENKGIDFNRLSQQVVPLGDGKLNAEPGGNSLY